MELTENEMYAVNGGIAWYVVAGVAGLITYVIGIFSGYTNPNKCNN